MSKEASLVGRRVLVTRAEGQADEMIRLLEDAGASVVHAPMIRFAPPPSWESLDEVLDHPESFDWLIFTSANGVKFFMDRLTEKELNTSVLSGLEVAAVGSATAAALRESGIEPDAVPGKFRGEEVVALLPDTQEGVRTALVRAREGREEIVGALRAKGGIVHVAIAYETIIVDQLPMELRQDLSSGSIDVATFTSPSTARGLLENLSRQDLDTLARVAKIVSIGPTTTAALRELGVSVIHEARESTTRGLISAVIEATA